jgi:hypothetical protein
VLAAVLAGRPVQWLADEIIEPVRAEAGTSDGEPLPGSPCRC